MPKNVFPLLASIALCEAVGIASSLFTFSSVTTWYPLLNKPSFNPPNWVFGPAWTILYALMGVSLYLVWKKGIKNKKVVEGLKVFFVQLAFNFSWSLAFFGLQNPLLGLVVIICLWISIVYTIILFKKVSQIAALLLLPYILWVTFAIFLNLFIILLNY